MTALAEFKAFLRADGMQLEEIIAEVYSGLAAGRAGFAMFDGGAHRGYHTRRMLALPGVARVIAVEADPHMAGLARAALAAELAAETPRLDLVEAALQRHAQVTRIAWRSSSSHQGRSSIVSAAGDQPTIWEGNAEMVYREQQEVAATTIDRLTSARSEPLEFLKLDLEGADLHALFGGVETLRRHRPVVAFENSINAPAVHGFTTEEAEAFFRSLGYVPLDVLGRPITAQKWFRFFQAWAAPEERLDAFRRELRAALQRRGLDGGR